MAGSSLSIWPSVLVRLSTAPITGSGTDFAAREPAVAAARYRPGDLCDRVCCQPAHGRATGVDPLGRAVRGRASCNEAQPPHPALLGLSDNAGARRPSPRHVQPSVRRGLRGWCATDWARRPQRRQTSAADGRQRTPSAIGEPQSGGRGQRWRAVDVGPVGCESTGPASRSDGSGFPPVVADWISAAR